MQPIKLKPVFKKYIWGGANIKRVYGKDTPLPPVSESWEVSAHKDGLCVAENAEYKGKTIPELCRQYQEDLYGDSMEAGDEFPLLLKILDAEAPLSIQVHPGDAYAYAHENKSKGKTEAWYILEAREDAKLIYGFQKDITKEELKQIVEKGEVENVLNYVSCKEGDVFYVPSGTVHAIGKGLLVAEIQQSSNIAYRLYDYNRRDQDGSLRELHVDRAIEVSNLKSCVGKEKSDPVWVKNGSAIQKRFIENEFFTFDELTIGEEYTDHTHNRMQVILVIEGQMCVEGVPFQKGESGLIPASIGAYHIRGEGKVLRFFC